MTSQRYFRQSMLAYFAKWHPRWQVIILQLAWALVWPLVWLADSFGLKGNPKS